MIFASFITRRIKGYQRQVNVIRGKGCSVDIISSTKAVYWIYTAKVCGSASERRCKISLACPSVVESRAGSVRPRRFNEKEEERGYKNKRGASGLTGASTENLAPTIKLDASIATTCYKRNTFLPHISLFLFLSSRMSSFYIPLSFHKSSSRIPVPSIRHDSFDSRKEQKILSSSINDSSTANCLLLSLNIFNCILIIISV